VPISIYLFYLPFLRHALPWGCTQRYTWWERDNGSLRLAHHAPLSGETALIPDRSSAAVTAGAATALAKSLQAVSQLGRQRRESAAHTLHEGMLVPDAAPARSAQGAGPRARGDTRSASPCPAAGWRRAPALPGSHPAGHADGPHRRGVALRHGTLTPGMRCSSSTISRRLCASASAFPSLGMPPFRRVVARRF
jgi:hypothetical protein